MPLEPKDIYTLEKAIWTERDFDTMGWHDATIHGIGFDPEKYELLFDIDYIFAWVNPEPPAKHFTLWVAPSTLVFRNVCNVRCDIETSDGLEILDLSRKDPKTPVNAEYIVDKTEWTWILDTTRGEIQLNAVGFHQYTREKPKRMSRASFPLAERGGISFEKKELQMA